MRKEITPVQHQRLVDYRLATDTDSKNPTIIINTGANAPYGVSVRSVGFLGSLKNLFKNMATGLVVAVIALSFITKTKPSEGLAMIESKIMTIDITTIQHQALQFIGFSK